MKFKQITAFNKETGVYDEDDFKESVYIDLPERLGVRWNDIGFCFQNEDNEDELLNVYSFLEENAEFVEALNDEVKLYTIDELLFALIDAGDMLGIASKKSQCEEFTKIY